MNVTRYATAPPYQAPGHTDMSMVRLQGREAGPSDCLWVGVSEIRPGGGTTLDKSSLEKIYVVLDGEVVVSNGMEDRVLAKWDSCRIAPGEGRQLHNKSQMIAIILLAMPVA